MHRSDDALARAILELAAFINDPRQDGRMMAEAGLDLDPIFLPLLVRLGGWGPASVGELAGLLGRDHSTMSRQLARLEVAGLVVRAPSDADGRVRTARATERGAAAFEAIAAARRRLLDRALAGWSARDRETLSRLFVRFTDGLRVSLAPAPSEKRVKPAAS
jgi:DNA-binding MarR family transcriptional regulator